MTGLLGMLVLWKYQGWIILGVAVWFSWKVWEAQVAPRLHERRLRQRAEQAALKIRAAAEDRQWLEAGLYEGHYPAQTMPLTDPFAQSMYEATEAMYREPRDWYDYDDGLDDWK